LEEYRVSMDDVMDTASIMFWGVVGGGVFWRALFSLCPWR